MMKIDLLVEKLSTFHPRGYDLSLGRIRRLLEKLGQPQDRLPPVFHVAGTNGKGSVIANLRAILEAASLSAHVHTSPHLVDYHERYRLGHNKSSDETKGKIVSDDMLTETLERVAEVNGNAQITIFELLAASMFLLFSEQEADYVLVEVGLGGRLDATNVITAPLASIITGISLDHQAYLGEAVEQIAFEKAGIIKRECPVIIGPQPEEARQVLEMVARENNCPTMIAGQDFDFHEEAGRFVYRDNDGLLDLPLPALHGDYQLANSASAIAATRLTKPGISRDIYAKAMKELYWPGRFERLPQGKITALFGDGQEIWIDGGHNTSAGETIARELQSLNERLPKKLIMICAMLNSRDPKSYFAHFLSLEPEVFTTSLSTSSNSISPPELALQVKKMGIRTTACRNLKEALSLISQRQDEFRLLISGSLYLVGDVFRGNNTTPRQADSTFMTPDD